MGETENTSEIAEYNKDIEDLFITFIMSKPDLFTRCKNIINPSYFDDKQNRETVAFIENYSREFNTVPSLTQIKAVTKKDIVIMGEEIDIHENWFLREFERFCRHKALRDAILASPELLEKGRYGEVESNIKKAVQIALIRDLGTDYYANPKARLEAIRQSNGQLSTGWKAVDEKLYGGLNKGEITIFAGQSGTGKSLFLQNLAVGWALSGLNVVYLSLELNEKLSSIRIDAMHTGLETREVMKHIDDVHIKLKDMQRKANGKLQIKQLPNGCNANDVRAYIKELEIAVGRRVDAVLVDYLDLMTPMSIKVSSENMFIKDKYITEELRNVAVELDIVCVSASQLNRGSYEQAEFDPSHIAGGISKVNTADNVIGIFTNATMKQSGRYQVQFMKTRSSSGVGSRVDLAFDLKSLKISDIDEDSIMPAQKSVLEMYHDIKRNTLNTNKKDPANTSPATSMNSGNVKDGAAAIMSLVKHL